MKKTLKILFFSLLLLQSVCMANVAFAQIPSTGGTCIPTTGGTCTPPPTTPAANVDLPNPLGNTVTVPALIRNIINASLGIVGSLALIMFIYGGFTWMLAAGNEQAVEKGKRILTWATIGLVVIFASYSLVNFVIKAITKGGA